MHDHDPKQAAADTPPRPGPSRRTVLVGTAGIAAAALFADVSGVTHATGSGTPAQAASGQPVEPRHGAGEWTEDPEQSGLSQSTTPVTGDIAAMPLDRNL